MTTEISLAAAIIAVIQFLKTAPGISDFVRSWATIVVAAVLGILAGVTGFQGLTWFTGLLSGLIAVGTMTVVQNIGSNKSGPTLG